VLVLSLVSAVVAYYLSDYASSELTSQPLCTFGWSADCEEALIQGRWTVSRALMPGCSVPTLTAPQRLVSQAIRHHSVASWGQQTVTVIP